MGSSAASTKAVNQRHAWSRWPLFALLAALSVSVVRAAPPPDPYADALQGTSGSVTNPGNALGAPDGACTGLTQLILPPAAVLTLDMGAGEEGVDDLLVYYSGLLNIGVLPGVVEFLNESMVVLDTESSPLLVVVLGNTQATYEYAAAPLPYRYIRIRTQGVAVFCIDAVEALDYIQPTATPTETLTPSNTPTETLTPSPTPSNTPTETLTPSQIPSGTPTETLTASLTASLTPSATLTPSLTPSETPTETLTPSLTRTETLTPSETPTETLTPSETPTATLSPSLTASYTPTETFTPSLTASQTPTETLTPSQTPTETFTPSETPTETLTPSLTASQTPTETLMPSLTASGTPTPSHSPTASLTLTPSSTGAASPTHMATPAGASPSPQATRAPSPTEAVFAPFVFTNPLPSPTPQPTHTLGSSPTSAALTLTPPSAKWTGPGIPPLQRLAITGWGANFGSLCHWQWGDWQLPLPAALCISGIIPVWLWVAGSSFLLLMAVAKPLWPRAVRLRPSRRLTQSGFALINVLDLGRTTGLVLGPVVPATPAEAIRIFRQGGSHALTATLPELVELTAAGEDLCLLFAFGYGLERPGKPDLLLDLQLLVVRRDTLASHADIYRDLLLAWDALAYYFHKRPQDFRILMAKMEGDSPPVEGLVLGMRENSQLFLARNGERIQKLLEKAFTVYSPEEGLPPDFRHLVDIWVLKKAMQQGRRKPG